jgi:hypothetical protein
MSMDSEINNTIKHPKSINNIQCIGPCYEAGSVIIHPVTLEEITNPVNNFCPVDNVFITNPKTGEKMIEVIDFCYMPTISHKDKSILNDDLRKKLLAPTFKFNSSYFLKIYYNIGSLEEGVEWLEKNDISPFKTKERVFNQIMLVHGDNLSIADHRIVKFIRDIMIYNLQSIFRAVAKYIDIRDDKIVLTSPEQKQNEDLDKSKIGLINSYIKTRFLGESEIGRFVSKFVRYGSEHLKKPNLSVILVDSMADYIVKRIETSIA